MEYNKDPVFLLVLLMYTNENLHSYTNDHNIEHTSLFWQTPLMTIVHQKGLYSILQADIALHCIALLYIVGKVETNPTFFNPLTFFLPTLFSNNV